MLVGEFFGKGYRLGTMFSGVAKWLGLGAQEGPVPEGGTRVWRNVDSSGVTEAVDVGDGVRKHFYNGEVELIEWNGRVYDPKGVEAKALFAAGVGPDQRREIAQQLEAQGGDVRALKPADRVEDLDL